MIHVREVTVELNGVKNRFDFVGELDNMLHLAEMKNSPSAGFTPHQKINLPKLMLDKPQFIPRGGNATKVKFPGFGVNLKYEGKYTIIIKHCF